MPLPTDPKALALSKEALQAFDNLNGGVHPGSSIESATVTDTTLSSSEISTTSSAYVMARNSFDFR